MQNDRLIVECECGCGNAYTFRYLDGTIFVSFLVGYHGAAQKRLASVFRDKVRLLFGKKRWIGEAIVSSPELRRVIHFLETHPCDNEPVENGSVILAERIGFDDEDECEEDMQYGLTLICTMPRYRVLLGKEYLAGEILINEELRKKYLHHFRKVLSKK